MSASLVNVKEHFSHLMLNHPAVNRPVRTRTRGGVGSGGEKPPLTRLAVKRTFISFFCVGKLNPFDRHIEQWKHYKTEEREKINISKK